MHILMFALTLARAALLALQLTLAIPISYLCLLAGMSLVAKWARRHAKLPPLDGEPPATRFAVLIPAHNEEVLLGVTLTSLAEQTYPRSGYQVIVIADNCTDRTAEIAASASDVWVYIRSDTSNPGKGQALRWAFERLQAAGHTFDAFFVIDADSRVASDALRYLAREIAGGAQAVQILDAVLNGDEAPSATVRWLALTLKNYLIPLGRTALGGSAPLLGNGMCFTSELLERYPWRASAPAEDAEYYLTLVQAGVRVRFVAEASVRSHMPTTFGQMRTQDVRWETRPPRHHEHLIRLRLLRDGLRQRDVVRLEALASSLIPPLSLLVGFTAASTLAAGLLLVHTGLVLGAALLLGLLFYVSSALFFERPPQKLWQALLYLPAFALWKVWVVLVLSRSTKHAGAWIRTSRPAPVSESGERVTTKAAV
jgi:hypothetical protein